MITTSELKAAQQRAGDMIRQANILITDRELDQIRAADFGLSHLEQEGAQILTFIETERIGVKVIILFPYQTLPEHWHPPVDDDPGKEESFRMIAGTLYFYIPGENTLKEGCIPESKEDCYTARHEIVMKPADQITVTPGVKHWLQAGSEGAVLYSFSTCVRDVLDGFSDPDIVRTTKIIEG